MKTLRGLDSKPDTIEEVSATELEKLPNYRTLLKMSAGNVQAKDGDEAIDLVQIGLKLKCAGDVELEDAEFKLLKEKVDKNEAKLLSTFHGQVLLKLKESEKKDA